MGEATLARQTEFGEGGHRLCDAVVTGEPAAGRIPDRGACVTLGLRRAAESEHAFFCSKSEAQLIAGAGTAAHRKHANRAQDQHPIPPDLVVDGIVSGVKGGTPGMRTKPASSSSRRFIADVARSGLPRSTATKLVADGRVLRPSSVARPS